MNQNEIPPGTPVTSSSLPVEPVPVDTLSPPPRPRIWGFWATVGFSAIIFGVYLIVQTVVLLAFLFLGLATESETDFSIFAQNLSTNGMLLALATILSGLAGAGLIVLFVKIKAGASLRDYLGLHRLSGRRIAGVIIGTIGLLLISGWTSSIVSSSQDEQFMQNIVQTSEWPWLLGIAVVVFAPLFEEGFFRGFLFAGLRHSPLGPAGAVILTSLFWAALHVQYTIAGVLVILGLGIIMGIVRQRTGSLWSTLLMHAMWNLAAYGGALLTAGGS